MDIGSITKLALSLLGKRDELLAIVQEALALWSKIQKVMPGLTEQLKGLTGEKPAAAAPKMDIRWLQESLNKLISANLTVDGNYGKATQDAVKQFQQANNLTADGWAGVQTQAAIVDALG